MKISLFIPIKLNNQRLPGKNIKLLDGKPLCKYLFDSVAKIDTIKYKYVYCSDEKIIPYIPDGLEFFKRDKKLDEPLVKGLEIIEGFVNDFDADIYIITHVTQPFTKTQSIINALEKVKSGEYDSAFSAVKLQDYLWYHGKPFNYDMQDIPRTQDLEPVYMETGAFFIFTKEVFTKLHRRIGNKPYIYEIDQFEAVDIDVQEDFDMAEAIVNFYKNKGVQF